MDTAIAGQRVFHGLWWEWLAWFFLLLTHQAVSPGVEMGSRGGRGRGPGSLGEPGGGDLGGLSSPDLGLDLSLIISK